MVNIDPTCPPDSGGTVDAGVVLIDEVWKGELLVVESID
jgi:hypothetical protein